MSHYLFFIGFWFSPECAFVRETLLRGQNDVTGKVKLRLFKGAGEYFKKKSF
jgi:argininosuccinate synthase